jgi:hypothetical protein
MSSERRAFRRLWALPLLVAAAALGCADFSRGSTQMTPGPGGTADGGAGDGKGGLSFAADVDPLLSICMNCHVPGGAASDTALVFTGNAATDYTTILQFVDTSAAAGSRILAKVSGNGHGGGTIYAAGSPEYETLLAWIQQGARP